MTVEDLHDIPDRTVIETRVCVVGAGPAGISIALQMLDAGIETVLVESGGHEPDPDIDDLSEIVSTGLSRAPQDVTRARGFGGTSSLWTGRCGVFDEMDLAARQWVPLSGWPVSSDELRPHLDHAGALLGLGPGRFRGAAADELAGDPGRPWDQQLLQPLVYQFSLHDPAAADAVRSSAERGPEDAAHIGALQHAGAPRPVHFGEAHLATFRAAQGLRVLTRGSVTEVTTDDEGDQVTGVEVGGLDGRRVRITAGHVVLCCGGVDNARLLLASRSSRPEGVGNRCDNVGRFLSDHPLAVIASYEGSGDTALRRRMGLRWIDHGGARHVYAIGARLSPELQRREGLLNASIHVVEYGERDAAAAELRAAVQRLSTDPRDRDAVRAAARIGLRPDKLAGAAYDRYVRHRPSLIPADRVDFCCVVEQVPDAASRITLADTVDGFGMPRAEVHWRAHDDEFRTLVRAAELFDREVRRLGYAPPTSVPWQDLGADAWRESIHDMAHPMGSTRMSIEPRDGVVDPQCRVHGVRGLFVAGGSVFPTSGYMNPTLMIVALALRTAAHIRSELGASPARVTSTGATSAGATRTAGPTTAGTTTTGTSSSTSPSRRLRVGLVGAGPRMTSFHLPVLRALTERFEVVGAVGGPTRALDEVEAATGETAFADAASLVAERSPELLLAAVAPGAVDAVVPSLVELGVPLLVETPFCWDASSGRSTLARIEENGLLVGVCEQTPFMPTERLRQLAVERGYVGAIHLADNDGYLYDYHALAALRTHLVGERAAVAALSAESPLDRGATTGRSTVVYGDGAVLRHRSGDGRPDGASVGTLLEGTSGAFRGDTLELPSTTGAPWTSTIERIEVDGRLSELRLAVPDGELTWRNPYAPYALDDERVAIATVVDGMRSAVLHGTDPLYTPGRALFDMELLVAFRSALRSGDAIPLPLRPRREQLRQVSPKMVAGRATQVTSQVAARLQRS